MPGYTLTQLDPQTGRSIIKQVAGQTYSGLFSCLTTPITSAKVEFKNEDVKIGGIHWAVNEDGQFTYNAEFANPVPTDLYCWSCVTADGETHSAPIAEGAVSSGLTVNGPVKSCSIMLKHQSSVKDEFKSLYVKSVTLSPANNKGDVNGDGKTDISDVVSVINIIAGK